MLMSRRAIEKSSDRRKEGSPHKESAKRNIDKRVVSSWQDVREKLPVCMTEDGIIWRKNEREK